MEIKIIKNEQSKWRFPCKGKSLDGCITVGFISPRRGTVIETQLIDWPLYKSYDGWTMEEFEPIEEKQPVDWNKVEFPLIGKKNENIYIIHSYEDHGFSDFGITLTKLGIDGRTSSIEEFVFDYIEDRNEWLDGLEILPKGTEIKITI